jgi:hypothetical protein
VCLMGREHKRFSMQGILYHRIGVLSATFCVRESASWQNITVLLTVRGGGTGYEFALKKLTFNPQNQCLSPAGPHSCEFLNSVRRCVTFIASQLGNITFSNEIFYFSCLISC